MKKIIIFLMVLLCIACKESDDPHPYTFYSTKNFNGTDVEKLAKYVKRNDTTAIVKFLEKNPDISIDTRDKYFGASLLMWAVYNHKYKSFHCLLNRGADPNFESYEHDTPLLLSFSLYGLAIFDSSWEYDTRYCKELLEHGADPNKNLAIHDAACKDLRFVKMLIKYGADYNVKNDNKEDLNYGSSPADYAILQSQPEIAEYLIIEKKALLYKTPLWSTWEISDPKFSATQKKIIEYLKQHPEQLLANPEEELRQRELFFERLNKSGAEKDAKMVCPMGQVTQH